MIIIGCDYHPSFQQIAFVDTETGELQDEHRAASHMPDVSVPLRVPPLLSIRSDMSSMQGAARFSNVLPSDSVHCFRRRVVWNDSLRLHETRPRLAFDRMALRFGSGFHRSRIYSSGLSSEAGTPRARQHLVEVDVSLRGDLADSCRSERSAAGVLLRWLELERGHKLLGLLFVVALNPKLRAKKPQSMNRHDIRQVCAVKGEQCEGHAH